MRKGRGAANRARGARRTKRLQRLRIENLMAQSMPILAALTVENAPVDMDTLSSWVANIDRASNPAAFGQTVQILAEGGWVAIDEGAVTVEIIPEELSERYRAKVRAARPSRMNYATEEAA